MANIPGNFTIPSLGIPDAVELKPNGNQIESLGYPYSTIQWSEGSITQGLGDSQQSTIASAGGYSGLVVLGYNLDTTVRAQGSYTPSVRMGDFQHYLNSFARFFGINAKQDATKLYINKVDLPGLTPQLNNTAESLLVALLLQEMIYESNSLISKVVIDKLTPELTTSKDKPTIINILLVNMYRFLTPINYELQDSVVEISPNNI